MKQYILIFVIFILPALNFGQTSSYNPNYLSTQYYDWGGNDNIFGMSPNNPDIVLSGVTDSKAVIMKTDNQGNILWTWTGAPNSGIGEIFALPNSTYVFQYSIYQENSYSSKIASMSQNGLILWEKYLSPTYSRLISIDTNSEKIASLDNSFTIKILDYNGESIDSLTLNDNANIYGHMSLQGNSIIVSGLGNGGTISNCNSFIAKYQKNNSSWEKIWQNTLLDGTRTSFTIDNAGYIYLGTTLFYTNHSSYIAQKLDQNGNIIWSQEWTPANATAANIINDVILLPDNKGILLAGYHMYDSAIYSGIIIAYDLEGNFLFQKENPENNTNTYRRAKFDQEKRLVLTGETYSSSTNTNNILLQFWSIDGITAVEPLPVPMPTDFSLSQNFPNPFNPTTTIQFSVPQGTNVQLKIFNLLGQEIETLVDEYLPSGTYSAQFTATGLPSSIYIYQLQAGDKIIEKKKMVLLK